MRILGIDASKHSTGFAFLVDGKIQHTDILLFEKGSKVGAFLSRLRSLVQKKVIEFKPEYVVIEDLNIFHMNAARHLFLYHGVLQEAVWNSLKSEAIYVVNNSWRAKLGIKNPSKDDKISKAIQIGYKKNGSPIMREYDVKCATLEVINQKMGTSFVYEENDLADAVGLCLWGEIALKDGPLIKTKKEKNNGKKDKSKKDKK